MPEGFVALDARGYTSTIYHIPGEPPRICKSFNEDRIKSLYPVEKAAYERFSAHDHPPSILKYYGVHESLPAGLVLEYAENLDVLKYLWDLRCSGQPSPEKSLLYRWAEQAAEALEFAHSLGVCNSDIHCINFFLDDKLNLKVGDWAGASIDGSKSRSSYRLRHVLFDADGTEIARVTGITALTEIFALGTALYVMVIGHELWPELHEPEDRDKIKQRISRQEFPPKDELPILGDVISNCWHQKYTSMSEVRHAIRKEAKEAGVDNSVGQKSIASHSK